MNFNPENLMILMVAIFGSFVTVLMSKFESWRQSLAQFVSGVFVAFVFTRPFMTYLEIDVIYAGAVGGMLGMLGSGIARSIVEVSNDPSKATGYLGIFFDVIAAITGQTRKNRKDDDQ